MSNTLSSTMITHPAYAIDGNYERDVGSELRYLGFGKAPFTSLVDGLVLDSKTGKVIKKGGLISKRTVKNMRYEMFSRAPHPTKVTVTAAGDGTITTADAIQVDSVNGLPLRSLLFNPRNGTTCRVEAINTLGLHGTSVGATIFSAEVGDELEIGAPAIPAGSSTEIVENGTDDQVFNLMQYTRYGCSIDWVAERVRELAGGERFTREKMYLVWELLLKIEKACIWSDYTADYATKNTQTGHVLSEEFSTTKGLVKIAANSYDMLGSFTLSKLRKDLPKNMGEYVNEATELLAFCSNDFYGELGELIAEKHYNVEKEGVLDKYGIKCQTFLTSGPTIKFIPTQSFNNKGAKGSLLIFDPAAVGFVHFEGLDMKPNNGIQTPATHGKIDELVCYFGAETKDSGKSITYVTNCL
jgi:hypothetical protein